MKKLTDSKLLICCSRFTLVLCLPYMSIELVHFVFLFIIEFY